MKIENTRAAGQVVANLAEISENRPAARKGKGF